MKSSLVHLATLAVWFSDCAAWDEKTFASCVWSCVTKFPTPDCDRSRSGSWESCFCSNETSIAQLDSCIDSSSCAESEKIDASELCSSTGPYASATHSAYLSSQYDESNEIEQWSTEGGSWSDSHGRWSTSGTRTWYDQAPWPTGAAGPWGSGSWPHDKCPGPDWPGWTSSGSWDKSDWDSEWTSWSSWTDCSTTTSTTTDVSTTAPSTVLTTSTSPGGNITSSFSTAVAGGVAPSTPGASASVPPQVGSSGGVSVARSDGRLGSVRFMATGATLVAILSGMMIMF